MGLDEFVSVACLIGAVISWAGYRYFSENVYLRYAGDRGKK